MAFAPKQSKANQIWLLTYAVVILALAIETRPHTKTAPTAGPREAAAQDGKQALDRQQ
jgi:hypothetical protein